MCCQIKNFGHCILNREAENWPRLGDFLRDGLINASVEDGPWGTPPDFIVSWVQQLNKRSYTSQLLQLQTSQDVTYTFFFTEICRDDTFAFLILLFPLNISVRR